VRSVTLKGSVHFGFAKVYAAVAPAILAAVLSEVVKSGADTVTVAGHSLGAGVGQLMAFGLQVGCGT
jgi:putative exporter of polyketide antibiotics